MSRVYLFSDEAGDFTFRRGQGISEYFLIATVMTPDCVEGETLLRLRRELAWRGQVLESFHAVDDRNPVRSHVYDLIAKSNLRIDVTALHKPRAQRHLSSDPAYFYKMANFLHFKYVIPQVTGFKDDLMVVASSLQIKRKRTALHNSVRDVVRQVSPTTRFVTAWHKNDTDPCLQLADYGAWAVQRSLERSDDSWLNVIRHNVQTIFHPFNRGTTIYY